MIQHALTYKTDGIARQLIGDSIVRFNNKSKDKVKTLWDTGASGTCISSEVVKELELSPISMQQVYTPSGISVVNVYLIDIILPNGVLFQNHEVFDSEIGRQGLDMLIGMDIISSGTFTVSNYGGKTTFSFVVPSDKVVDYVKDIRIKNITSKSHQKKQKKR